MSPYTDVLIATDGSDSAREAATHAIDMAREYGATLHVVYVVETRMAYDNAIVDPETVSERLREEGERATAAIADDARSVGVDVVTDVEEGIPPDEILSYVGENQIDVVVMGAQGRSAFKTVLLGSTVESVLHGTSVPVLVVGR